MTYVKCVVVFMAQTKQLLVFEKIASEKLVSTQFMINQSMGFQESIMFYFQCSDLIFISGYDHAVRSDV